MFVISQHAGHAAQPPNVNWSNACRLYTACRCQAGSLPALQHMRMPSGRYLKKLSGPSRCAGFVVVQSFRYHARLVLARHGASQSANGVGPPAAFGFPDWPRLPVASLTDFQHGCPISQIATRAPAARLSVCRHLVIACRGELRKGPTAAPGPPPQQRPIIDSNSSRPMLKQLKILESRRDIRSRRCK